MRTSIILTLAALLALPAVAQDEQDPEEQLRQRAQRRMGGYRSLDLDESQREQILEILIAEERAKTKTDEKRQAKIKAILRAPQKKKYQRILDGKARAWSDRALRMVGLDHGRFAGKLEMTDDQQAKLDDILSPATKRFADAWKKQQSGGKRWDWQQWLAFAKQLRADILPKIKATLKEEQLKGFDEINAEYQKQMDRWVEEQERRTGQSTGRKEDPAKMAQKLLDLVMEDLALGEEEDAVLRPLIEKLIKHKIFGTRDLASRRKKLTVDKPDDEEMAQKKVAAYRKAKLDFEAKHKTLQEAVRELLTVQQEAVLVGHDLLP